MQTVHPSIFAVSTEFTRTGKPLSINQLRHVVKQARGAPEANKTLTKKNRFNVLDSNEKEKVGSISRFPPNSRSNELDEMRLKDPCRCFFVKKMSRYRYIFQTFKMVL